MKFAGIITFIVLLFSCSKKEDPQPEPPVPKPFKVASITVDGQLYSDAMYNVNFKPVIKITCAAPIFTASVPSNIFIQANGTPVSYDLTTSNNDSVLILKPTFTALTNNKLTISPNLTSKDDGYLQSQVTATLISQIDSTDKFPRISDDALLTLIQQQHLNTSGISAIQHQVWQEKEIAQAMFAQQAEQVLVL